MTHPTYVEAIAAYNAALDHESDVRRNNPAQTREAELRTQAARRARDDAARMRT